MSANTDKPRIFVTGSNRILEDESMRGKSIEQVQAMLKYAYPELANATAGDPVETDEALVITFLAKPGRKG